MFVNRVSELEQLEKRFASGKAEFFVLYGRRRVGKTELLARFCEGKRSIFFVSDLGSEISLRTARWCWVKVKPSWWNASGPASQWAWIFWRI